jgi:CHAT domain-containing protein
MKLPFVFALLLIVSSLRAESASLDSLLLRGSELCADGKLQEGARLLEEAKNGFKAQEEWTKYAEASVSFWFAKFQLEGNADKPIAAFSELIGLIVNELPDSTTLLADLYLYKSMIHYYAKEFHESLIETEKALKLYNTDRTGNLQSIGSLYNNLGALYSAEGNIRKAEDYYIKSLEVKTEFDDQGIPYSEIGIVGNYLNLASLYFKSEEFDKFLDYQRKTKENLHLVEVEPRNLIKHYKNYLKYYLRVNQNLDSAQLYLNRLNEVEQSIDVDFLNALGNRGFEAEYFEKTGDIEKAKEIHQGLILKAEENFLKDDYGLLEYYLNSVEFYVRLKDFKSANDYLAKCFNIVKDLAQKSANIRTLNDLSLLARVYGARVATLYHQLKNGYAVQPSEIVNNGEEYLNCLKSYASRVDVLKGNYTFIDFDVVMAALLEQYTETGDNHKAMELVELQQAIPLIKHRVDLYRLHLYDIDSDLTAHFKETSKKLNDSRQQYSHDNTSAINDSIAQEIYALSLKKDSLNKKLLNQISEKGGNVFGPLDTDIAQNDVIRSIEKDECLVHFIQFNNSVYTILSAPEDEGIILETPVSDIKEKIVNLREALLDVANYNQDSFRTYASGLYSDLIDPVNKKVKDKDLVIVPTGIFNYIPFEVLMNPKTNDYLIQERAVRYLYSIKTIGEKESNSNGTKLAFAPDFNNTLNQAYAIRSGYDALEGAQLETKILSNAYGFELFNGKEASKQNFLASVKQANLIHLASHAMLDEVDPMRSFIVFDNLDSLSKDEQRLYAYELYGLNLNADLAVLSACNTGMGKQKKFNGVVSLAKAFQFAGVNSTVMSLWPVQDESTAEIMQLFYGFLDDGLTKSEALRQAKLAYLESADDIHKLPFYWAPFILQGNNDPVPLKQKSWYLYVIGGIALASIIYLILRRRRLASAA